MKCFVYRNLHKPGYVYSIRALEGPYKGRVIAYGSKIVITNVQFRVGEKGRQRVLATGVKNVHAGIVGDVAGVCDLETRLPNTIQHTGTWHLIRGTQISYNPRINRSFVAKETGEPVYQSDCVQIDGGLLQAV
jgi:hypothetical protein